MDLYDSLWNQNLEVAERTLKVPFVQHMQTGDLQADYYTVFMIQDINYLVKVTDMLKVMCEQVNLPVDIRQFMQDRYRSYKEYADDTLKQFNLSVRNHLFSFSHLNSAPVTMSLLLVKKRKSVLNIADKCC